MENQHIDEVLIAVRRVIRATDLQSKHLTKTTGLTTPQLLILQAIDKQPDLTIGLLAKKISLSQATVTTIIDRLENRELIKRTRDYTDRRKVHIHITDTGIAMLEKAPPALQEQFINQFSALQDWEQSMIIASLQRLAEMMDAQNLDAAPILTAGSMETPE